VKVSAGVRKVLVVKIAIDGSVHELVLPDGWVVFPPLPGDPPGQIVGYEGPDSMANVFVRAISPDEQLPADRAGLLDGIRACLPDNAAIIKVDTGVTEHGYPYRCSIVKTLMRPSGVQYNLTFQFVAERMYQIQGYFGEVGMTGMRDTVVWDLWKRAQMAGQITEESAPWMQDPYDGQTDRFAMNVSEREQFDGQFPSHPLSVARQFLRDHVLLVA